MPVCYCRICKFAESELNTSMICGGGADTESKMRLRPSLLATAGARARSSASTRNTRCPRCATSDTDEVVKDTYYATYLNQQSSRCINFFTRTTKLIIPQANQSPQSTINSFPTASKQRKTLRLKPKTGTVKLQHSCPTCK